jgi:hypothetical protein
MSQLPDLINPTPTKSDRALLLELVEKFNYLITYLDSISEGE